VYVLEPSVLERIPAHRVYSAERELFPAMAAEGRLFAHPPGGYWIDIGTPDKYLQANIDAVTGRYHDRAGGACDENEVLSATGARVARNARVTCSVLGADSSVGAAATVDRSVLLPGAIVEEGATVTGSILGERAVVAAGVTISAGVLADGENLGDDGGGQ
jgi:mannose-1-phosphate guanylyltransferase